MAESPADLFYGIYLDGIHVGTIKLAAINARHETADLSYIIDVRQDCVAFAPMLSGVDDV